MGLGDKAQTLSPGSNKRSNPPGVSLCETLLTGHWRGCRLITMSNELTFHESYGTMPESTLALFKRANVSPADWDSMLMRWGFSWGDETLPWADIERHVTVHMVNSLYRYPMYG